MTETNKCAVLGSIAIVLAALSGCSRPVKEPETPVQIPETFSARQTPPASEPLQEQWWRDFQDDELNALIERALSGNLNLQVAWDRLVQAHAVARQTNASLWPDANLQAGASKTYSETNGVDTETNLYSVGVAASYEVDLWSRLESTRRAAWLDVQASRDAVDTAAITLAASVASTWYQLAQAKALVRISQEQIETNKQVLDLVTVQFRNNLTSAANVFRQRQLVASTESTLISAQETVSVLQYALAVLTGQPPEALWRETDITMPSLTPQPDIGLPADVLLRRPDVRQAYREVQAADQRLAAAIANQYPRISLSANVQTSAASVRDLFDDWLANLATNLTQPLFDAGQRKAEVDRQRALVQQSIHTWSQTLLDALADVQTALTQEQRQKELLDSLALQLDLSRQAYERNRERFTRGRADYISVLESLQSTQSLERQIVAARVTLIQRRIDLHRSVAGPWDLPVPDIVHPDASDANAWNRQDQDTLWD